MSSLVITTGRWHPPWRSRFCCCWSVPLRSTSTTTCASSRPDARHGTALVARPALGAVLRHRAAVRADPGAHRLFLQRFAAGERLGWLLDRLVRAVAAQPPAARGGAAVAGGGPRRIDRRNRSGDTGRDRAGALRALSRAA